jgi:anti-anti-sigma factor
MAGEFDLSARDDLMSAMLAVVGDPATETVIVDVERATFIDSEALGALIVGVNAAREAGKPFRIVGATGVVHRVFEVAGLLDLINDHHHGP